MLTTTSRPVSMNSRNYNTNPVIDARLRFHEKDCQPAIEIHFAKFS
jgi:hypothetical protein